MTLSTTRFLYANGADDELGAAIYTGGAPPGGYALLATATGYEIENVIQHSRDTVVKFMDTNGLIDIDLGEAKDVEAFALMNVYLDSGSNFPVIKLYSSTDNATWDDHGEMMDAAGWVGTPNRYFKLPSIYPRRYWRVHVTTGTHWYLSNVFLGSYFDFTHGVFSPGSSYVKSPPVTRVRNAAGQPLQWRLGPAVERFTNVYETIEEDFATALNAISEAGKPFGYVHHDGILRHVIAPEDGIRVTAIAWDDGLISDATVEMESLV